MTGSVSDSSGARIGTATVTLVCGTVRTVVRTGMDGNFTIKTPPGSYDMEIEATGFATYHQAISLAPGALATQDVALKVGQTGGSVQVTADTGFVPYTSDAGSKTGATLSEVPQTISVITPKELGIVTLTWAVVVGATGVMNALSTPLFGLWRVQTMPQILAPYHGKPRPTHLESVDVAVKQVAGALPWAEVSSVLFPNTV